MNFLPLQGQMRSRLFLLVLGLLWFGGFSLNEDREAETLLGKIPVQSGGRVKPFASFAEEALLSVTGKRSLQGKSATLLVWEWIAKPEEWHTRSFLSVKYAALREEFPLMVIGGKISPEIILSHSSFQAQVKEARMKDQRKERLTSLERKRLQLYDQARLFQAIAQGELPGFLPNPVDPKGGWFPLAALAIPEERILIKAHYPLEKIVQFQTALSHFVGNFRLGSTPLLGSVRELASSLSGLIESRGIFLDPGRIQLELLYYQIRPFQWAWIFYLASGLLWFFLRGRFSVLASGFFLTGFISHTAGFVIRCYLAGRPPVTNMYESIIWVAWAVVFFSMLLRIVYKYKKDILFVVASWVASFALLVGESFPAVLDPSLSPLVPVLRNNYWLTVHVLTITLSYGAFALAWGLGHVQLFNVAFRPEKWEEKERIAASLYRALQMGVILLTAGTILGGIWANDSWGRFWGWDPKETWALIALLGYLVVLHGRFSGWLSVFGTALGSVLAFLGILMAWYGVNFVLAAGFHSYGFSTGGLPYVLSVVLLDLSFIFFLTFRYNKIKIRSALSHK